MTSFAPLTEVCCLRPSYQLMERAYRDYLVDRSPCKDPIATNQCAVRMSLALGRCGVSLGTFPNQARVHRNRPRCQVAGEHVLGAEELARYLAQIWGPPRILDGAQCTSDRGVIYFNNCFRRTGETAQRGDHVDLWTGSQYYNQVLGIGAGGNAGAGTSLFDRVNRGRRRDDIWFWSLQ